MTTDQLDRRRERSAAAHAAAEKARATVAGLDHRLQTNADTTRQQKQALRNAEAEAKRLKQVLKAQERERGRLDKARRKAVSRADKAQARAAELEEKYGRSVLADMVRREKERDRAAAGDATPAQRADRAAGDAKPAQPADPAAASAQRDGRADPPPEKPDPATAVATRTAARKTARRSA